MIPGGAGTLPELVGGDGQAPDGQAGQDPHAPGDLPGAGRRTIPRRRWTAAVLVLTLLAGLAVTGRVLAERPKAGSASTPATTAASPTGTPIRPSPIVATIATGRLSSGMVTGAGALWVAGSDGVTRIDPATNSVVAKIPVGATGSGPAGVAFGAGAVWVPVAVPGALWAIDPETNQVTARIPLGGPLREPISVSATRGSVWVACCGKSGSGVPASGGGTLFRVDPGRERVVAEIPLPADPVAVAADASAAWVATGTGRVLMVSTKRNRVVAGVDAGGPPGFSQTIALGAGAVWLAEPFDEQVVRVDPKTRRVLARIPAGAATTLTVTADAVWVISSIGLVRIDPAQNRVVAVLSDSDLGRARLVAAGAGAVWTAGWSSVNRIDPDLMSP